MEVTNLGPAGGYRTRLLQPPDLNALQSLLERSSDYFEIATGAPPAADEASRAYVAGPPTKSVDDKRVIGVFDVSGTLVGVLDALTDWPDPGVWMMGVLLLDPAIRRAGVGGAVLTEYEMWAATQGARELRTAVVAHHDDGIRFLRRAGYTPQRTVDGYPAGAQTATIVFLSKPLTV